MTRCDISLPQQKFGQTSRRDTWWLQPLVVFLGLSAFVIYGTWAAFQGNNYHYSGGGADYLSPFYSPVLFDAEGIRSGHAWFGPKPSWWPAWLVFSPALLILWAPGGFRLTCYYYRGAYYKAFWADPPSCAVGEPRKGYRGEASFPLIIQNIHRYFMYLAVAFIFILGYDAWRSMWFAEADGGRHFGVGVGTLVLTLNTILLAGYTLGCHSLRHLIGGRFKRLSSRPVRAACYTCVSGLNARHMLWAWTSLTWVAFADIYVRLCTAGVWSDWRIF
jgi:hypothetical protein